jgi:hypothetical protein
LDFLEFLANEFIVTDESPKNYLVQSEFLFQIAHIEEKQTRDEILNYFVAKFGEEFLNSSISTRVLHELCSLLSESYVGTHKIENYLNFVGKKYDLEILKNYVSGKNLKKQTILFYFYHYKSNTTKILEWFKTTFKNDSIFMKFFLLQVDENLDSFLIFLLKKCVEWDIDHHFMETYDYLLTNFDKVFVKEFLILENSEDENFLNIVCKRDDKNVTKILNIIFNDFENDQDFFTKLINEKSKKHREIKDFMRDKLNINVPEEEEAVEEKVKVSQSNSCMIC